MSTNKRAGTAFEYRVRDYLTDHGIPAKRQMLSGAHPDYPEDVIAPPFLIQCKKSRGRESITIQRAALVALWENADKQGLKPVLVFGFQRDRLYAIVELSEVIK